MAKAKASINMATPHELKCSCGNLLAYNSMFLFMSQV